MPSNGADENRLEYLTEAFLHEWDRRKYIDGKLASLAALSGVLLSVSIFALSLRDRSPLGPITTVSLAGASSLLALCVIIVLVAYYRTWSIYRMPLGGTKSSPLESRLEESTRGNRSINKNKAEWVLYAYVVVIAAVLVLAAALIALAFGF